jgi:hypothetical protein
MLLTLFIGYLLLALAVMGFQRRLIYFPTKLTAELAVRRGADAGFLPWRNTAGKIIGWHLPASTAPGGVVLIAHGNAGCAIDRGYLAIPIHAAAPVDVFVLEYPGYGAREGSPTLKSFLAAADEAFDLLPKGNPIYIVSESLGAGVAAHLAQTQGGKVSGLLLFMPYNNLASVAQSQMPLLPAALLLRDRFNPSEWLKNYRGPVAIVLAEADEVIPTKFGRRLYDDYAGAKNLQIIPGKHNDVADQSAEWWKSVFSFWERNRQMPNTAR